MGNDKIVSLTERREQLLQKGREENGEDVGFVSLMLSVSIFGTSNPEQPMDVLVSATNADTKYDLAALFEFQPDEPRMLALAEGLEKMAALFRRVHDERPRIEPEKSV